MGRDDWAEAQPLCSERLVLEPLRVEHADEMAPLLDDPTLHTFTGGKPATLEELRSRYARQVVGQPPDGSQHWLNWIVRRRDDGQAVGFVQATISEQNGDLTADVAWVVAVSQQRSGYRAGGGTPHDGLAEAATRPPGCRARAPPASRLQCCGPLDRSHANRYAGRRRSALARMTATAIPDR
jgi:hypothetical protein